MQERKCSHAHALSAFLLTIVLRLRVHELLNPKSAGCAHVEGPWLKYKNKERHQVLMIIMPDCKCFINCYKTLNRAELRWRTWCRSKLQSKQKQRSNVLNIKHFPVNNSKKKKKTTHKLITMFILNINFHFYRLLCEWFTWQKCSKPIFLFFLKGRFFWTFTLQPNASTNHYGCVDWMPHSIHDVCLPAPNHSVTHETQFVKTTILIMTT